MACAPSEDLDQPGHPPSLIRVFAVRSMGSQGPNASSCGQRRLCRDWADAQADLSLRWTHMPLYWFCHEAAYLALYPKATTSKVNEHFTFGKNCFTLYILLVLEYLLHKMRERRLDMFFILYVQLTGSVRHCVCP